MDQDNPPPKPSASLSNGVPPSDTPKQEQAKIEENSGSIHSESTPSDAREDYRCNCKPDQTPWWKYALELVAILVAIRAVAIYGGQLNVMTSTLGTMDRQLGEMKAQSNAIAKQERPWVAMDDVCMTNHSKTLDPAINEAYPYRTTGCGDFNFLSTMASTPNPEQIDWWAYPAESGQTPAVNTVFVANWCISGKTDDAPPSLSECNRLSTSPPARADIPALIPGQSRKISRAEGTINLSQSQIKQIAAENPDKWLFLIGCLRYTEPLNAIRHWTSFCWYYSPHYPWSGKYCRGGNKMDEEQNNGEQLKEIAPAPPGCPK